MDGGGGWHRSSHAQSAIYGVNELTIAEAPGKNCDLLLSECEALRATRTLPGKSHQLAALAVPYRPVPLRYSERSDLMLSRVDGCAGPE
jgi:hypothetical protein